MEIQRQITGRISVVGSSMNVLPGIHDRYFRVSNIFNTSDKIYHSIHESGRLIHHGNNVTVVYLDGEPTRIGNAPIRNLVSIRVNN